MKTYDHLSDFRRKLLESEHDDVGHGAKSPKRKRGGNTGLPSKKKKGEDGEAEEALMVPIKSIAQARHERHLVDILIKRHRQREEGDYISSLDELNLGTVFPGRFYGNQVVCKNCYCLYTLVDEHRARAVKKLERKADADALDDSIGSFSHSAAARPHTSPIKKSQRLFNAIKGIEDPLESSMEMSQEQSLELSSEEKVS